MQSNAIKAGAGVLVVVVAVALFAVLRDDGDGGGGAADTVTTRTEERPGAGKPKPAQEPTIVVRDGDPVGGIRELDYSHGDQIRFRVVSDVADEIHVHGYDLAKDVAAGGKVSFAFPASLEGIFEVELEQRGEQIAELRVNP